MKPTSAAIKACGPTAVTLSTVVLHTLQAQQNAEKVLGALDTGFDGEAVCRSSRTKELASLYELKEVDNHNGVNFAFGAGIARSEGQYKVDLTIGGITDVLAVHVVATEATCDLPLLLGQQAGKKYGLSYDFESGTVWQNGEVIDSMMIAGIPHVYGKRPAACTGIALTASTNELIADKSQEGYSAQ